MSRKFFKSASKFVGSAGLVCVLGSLAMLSACGSDDDASDNVAGGGSGATAGKGSSGNAGKANGGSAGKDEPGAGGEAGDPVEQPPANDGGAAGEAGAGNNPPEWDLHLSPTATPKTFDITTGGNDRFYGVAFDADDNIYAVGVTAPGFDTATDYSTVVAKFSPAGVLDTTFGKDGYAIRNVAVGTSGELARGIGIQSDGKIVVSETVEHAGAADARDRDIAVLRFNKDGSKDTTFGTDGAKIIDLSDGVVAGTAFLADSAWGFALYPDDRIVIEGGLVAASKTDTDFAIVRLSKDGEYDNTFGTKGVFTLDTLIGSPAVSNNASPRSLTLLPGKQGIIGGGYQPVPGADTKPCLFKVTDAGKIDKTFGVDGVFSEAVLPEQAETYNAVPQSDGSLITTGYGRELSTETTDILSMRLKPDGTRDKTYGGANGYVRLDIGGFADNSRKLVVLPNDHIVLVGGGRPTAADVDGVVVALTPDGKPDTTFNAKGWQTYDLGGPADFLWSVGVNTSQTSLVAVGIKGATTGTSNDDAALLIMKLVP